MNESPFNFGPCCACERSEGVRNICMVDKKCPLPGKGWACPLCGLSPDGACYVLCDGCFEKKAKPKWACRGYPGADGRIPFEELTGEHMHDLSKHPKDQLLTLEGMTSLCERCECCVATYFTCEECEGDGVIGIETEDGLVTLECPSCEGERGYWICERDCNQDGEHALTH